MLRDDSLYLGHMLDTARQVAGKVSGIKRSAYDRDENLRLALAHLIQVLGEAARMVSEPTRAAMPDIPWKEIVGMRHKIVHDYLNVDFDVVWEVATHDAPWLAACLEKHVAGSQQGANGSDKP